MPTYQYACTECEHAFEQVQSFSEDSLTECPRCHGRLRKLFNAVGVVFKGSGFYRTDSRADARNGAAASASGNGSASGSGSSEKKSADSASGSVEKGSSDKGSSEKKSSDSSSGGSSSSGASSSGSGSGKTAAAAASS